jgi:hypothetical protein
MTVENEVDGMRGCAMASSITAAKTLAAAEFPHFSTVASDGGAVSAV